MPLSLLWARFLWCQPWVGFAVRQHPSPPCSLLPHAEASQMGECHSPESITRRKFISLINHQNTAVRTPRLQSAFCAFASAEKCVVNIKICSQRGAGRMELQRALSRLLGSVGAWRMLKPHARAAQQGRAGISFHTCTQGMLDARDAPHGCACPSSLLRLLLLPPSLSWMCWERGYPGVFVGD